MRVRLPLATAATAATAALLVGVGLPAAAATTAPATWRTAASAAAPAVAPHAATLGAGALVPVGPTRVLDTRTGLGTSGPVPGGGVASFVVAGVPSGTAAVLLNVTVTAPTKPGYITAYADGTPRPTASNLNFATGQTVPNLVLTPVSAGNKVDLYVGSTGSVQLVADLAGYVVGGSASAAGAVKPVAPFRLLDTRTNLGAPGPVGPNATAVLQATGVTGSNVPASNVSAVVLNVTETAPTSAGVITVFADGKLKPTASNLNYLAGQTIPNLVLAPVSSAGKVDLANTSNGSVQLVADVLGYVVGGTPTQPGAVGSLDPTRLLDTRSGNGAAAAPVAGGGTVTVPVLDRAPVPAGKVAAVVLNVTVTEPKSAGYLTAYPSGAARPTASNLNFSANQTVPNLVVVPVGSDGRVAFYNGGGGTVHVIADVAGYVLRTLDTPSVSTDLDPSSGSPQLVSCGGSTTAPFCAATDAYGNVVSTTDGTTWTAPRQLDDGRFDLLGCGSGPFCLAFANDTGSPIAIYDGTSWISVGTTPAYFIGLDCASSSFCVAADDDGFLWQGKVDGFGVTWSRYSTAPAEESDDITCSKQADVCFASGESDGTVYRVTSSGFTAIPSIPTTEGTYADDLSCVDATTCVASRSDGAIARWSGGSTWTVTAVGTDRGPVTCWTTSACEYTDGTKVYGYGPVRGGGVKWYVETTSLPAGTDLESISCVAVCAGIAYAGDGDVVADRALSSTWRLDPAADPERGRPQDVACPTTTFCAAVDEGGAWLRWNGTSWSSPAVIDAGRRFVSVACPTATSCVAVDSAGGAVSWNGTSWSARVVADSAVASEGYVTDLSCPSTSYCRVVDSLGTTTTRSASGVWSAPATVNGSATSFPLYHVSCSSASYCVGLGSDDAYESTGGAFGNPYDVSYHPGGMAPIPYAPTDVSCTPGVAYCVVASTHEVFVRQNGTWREDTTVPGYAAQVSCPLVELCVVADDHALEYVSAVWTDAGAVKSGSDYANYTNAVSCAGDALCAVVTQDGTFTTVRGRP